MKKDKSVKQMINIRMNSKTTIPADIKNDAVKIARVEAKRAIFFILTAIVLLTIFRVLQFAF